MAICLHTPYIFTVPIKKISAENIVQAYLSNILTWKGGNVAILSDNGTEFKNKMLNKVCDQLSIKRLLANLFHAQGNAKMENLHNFLKRTLTKFLDNNNLEMDDLLPFACYCYNIFPGSNGTESPFFLMFGWDPAEGCLPHLNNSSRYYSTNEGNIVLEELHKLLKHHINHFREIHQDMNMRMF